ncbi:unnamed protein product [Dracunculus medinensis]|uniref:COX6C domain-containing protein n=1 Tax=Dracunculus medinensis TaxID=318479 RepID=A0A0N4UGF3_DRAME|nr:unnamed protein product [Dracunculus medinensis]
MKYQRFKIHLTTVGIIAGIVVSTYGVSRLALKIKEYSNEDSRFAEQEIQDWIYLKEIAAANQRQSQK